MSTAWRSSTRRCSASAASSRPDGHSAESLAPTRNVYDKVDVERARRLPAEAGHPNGIEAELYVTSTYEFLRTPAEVLRAQLGRAGILLRIVAADWSVSLPTVFQKRYTLTLLGTPGQTDPDDYLYNNFKTGDNRNSLNYSDAQFDKLAEEGRLFAGAARRKRIYDQSQMRLQETVPMVFLFYSTQFEAQRRVVRGFEHWRNTSLLGLRTT